MSAAGVDRLRENVEVVRERMRRACERAGRSASDVNLVGVTKTVSAELAGLLPGLGVRELGENRPQELWDKAGKLPTEVRWHLIGHLQRNKIERTLPLVAMIHSVDSMRVLEALEKEACKQGRPVDVLLEVNVSGEASKGGFATGELVTLAEPAARFTGVRLRGLMTMAPLQNAEECRPVFARLREERDRLAVQLSGRHDLTELSMGMSNDFEVAIEEGATMVRLGTVLWEGVATD